MQLSELLIIVLSWPFMIEAGLVTSCGVVAWWIDRRVAKLLEPSSPPPDAPLSVRMISLRLASVLTLPLAWVALLTVASAVLHQVMPAAGLVNLVIPAIWFFMLYLVASCGLAFFLPKRPGIRFFVWLAMAAGVVLLAAQYMGRKAELLYVSSYPVFQLGPANVSITVILKALLLFGAILFVAGQLTAFLQKWLSARTDLDPTLSSAGLRFLKFFFIGVGMLVVLDTAGINMSALTIFGGALGIGLGFGLQTIANNLVSGVILLLDRSIKQGDVITVGDSYGWVVKLGARYIVVRTRDGVEKLVPNASLMVTEITNWSHSDRAVRLHVKVGVPYDADPFKIRDLLLHVADNHQRVLKFPQPNVLFVNFGENAMEFELRLWINDPQEGVENVRSAMRFEIWKTFKENGIRIPLPQRELHIKNPQNLVPGQELGPTELEESFRPGRPSS